MRARKTPDVSKMGQAVSAPGIDPRIWVSMGEVVGESVVEKSGQYIAVRVYATGGVSTCRVAKTWAAIGGGSHIRVDDGSQVLCVFPTGTPREGGIALGELANAVEYLSDEVIADPNGYRFEFLDGRKVTWTTLGEDVCSMVWEDGLVTLFGANGVRFYDGIGNEISLTDAGVQITATMIKAIGPFQSTGAAAVPSLTIGGIQGATVGMPVPLSSDWVTWFTGLAAAAAFTTPMPTGPIGTVGA